MSCFAPRCSPQRHGTAGRGGHPGGPGAMVVRPKDAAKAAPAAASGGGAAARAGAPTARAAASSSAAPAIDEGAPLAAMAAASTLSAAEAALERGEAKAPDLGRWARDWVASAMAVDRVRNVDAFA